MWRSKGRITAVILIMAAVSQAVLEVTRSKPREYYIAPNGSNENRGDLNGPWETVEFGIRQLLPVDVLYLRSGTYYENGIMMWTEGTSAAPITIQAFPGERAIIDGGLPYFRETENAEWEIVNSDIGLYRSRRTFPEEHDLVRGWLVDNDEQLVEYESAENLESTNYDEVNGLEPFYMGPGLQLRNDGHIYIRLTNNPNDLTDADGNQLSATPLNSDPNHNSLAIFFSNTILLLDGASYVHFKEVAFSHAQYIMDVRNSHHIALSNCRLNFGNYGLVLRENVYDWEVSGCEFNNGLPDYVYWTDVKNRGRDVTEAYPEFQSVAISGSMPGFYIHDNLFQNMLDGLTVKDGTADARIVNNVFKELRGDAINLSRGISNVEVANNMLWRVMSGISNLGSDSAPGHVYIHHNVIDNSAYQRGGRPGNYREANWPIWTTGSPFADHDNGNKTSWWKLYNNTVVSRQSPGHRWSAAGPDAVTGNPEKYVFNNVSYIFGERVIFRNDLISHGSHYDGNVVYRSVAQELPLFSDFGDGGRYYTLLDFQTHSGTPWEAHGLEIDPQYMFPPIDDIVFDGAVIWERYLPGNKLIFSQGPSLDVFG